MKLIVPIKPVIDYQETTQVNPNGSAVQEEAAKWSMNPFDKVAIEAAIQLKAQGIVSRIIAVSIGDSCETILREALALGVDQGVHIQTQLALPPLNIAKLLAALVKQVFADLVIAGKQSIDGDNGQVGPMLAALLDWPQVTGVSQMRILPGDRPSVQIRKSITGGVKTVAVALPAVITTSLDLNQPRYPSLPNLLRAKKAPLTLLTPETLGVFLKPHVRLLRLSASPARKAGIFLDSASELIEKLTQEAGLMR